MHVSIRLARGLPSLRGQVLFQVLEMAIASVQSATFRVVQFSVQANHLHTICEAFNQAELTRAMRQLTIRIALRVNRALGRKRGKVWGDRYFSRILTSDSDVRNTLRYVLFNGHRHGVVNRNNGLVVGNLVLDPCSSAPWHPEVFDAGPEILKQLSHWRAPRASPVVKSRNSMLLTTWQPLGLLTEADMSIIASRAA